MTKKKVIENEGSGGRNISDELESEIKSYIDKSDKMDHQDKLDALRNLFIKHIQLEESGYLLDKGNLDSIISSAKRHYTDHLPSKMSINGKSIGNEQGTTISIIEATISELRKEKLLRKIVRFVFDDKYTNKP